MSDGLRERIGKLRHVFNRSCAIGDWESIGYVRACDDILKVVDELSAAPATPAATPMAQPQRALSELEVCIRARAYKHEDRELLQLCNQMRALLQPAAAQPQRESEQPEQLSGEDAWLDEFVLCGGNRDKLRTVLRAFYANMRAALSPQTDSQEPR